MADKKYIDYPFTPVPTELLQNMIDNQDAPLSHRILCLLLRELNDNRIKHDITASYIMKVLNYTDKRHMKRALESVCKIYGFTIENNGQGKPNKITSAKKGGGKLPPKKAEELPPKKAEELPPKKADTIESRIDSIERKRIIEITGDEWC